MPKKIKENFVPLAERRRMRDDKIIALWRMGWSYREMVKECRVSMTTIQRALKGLARKK